MTTLQLGERAALSFDSPPALVLTRAADLLAANGVHPSFYRHGVLLREYWPDCRAQQWRPGLPLSPLGAIGVALGHTRSWAVTTNVIPCTQLLPDPNHPAVDALCDHIGVTTLEPGLLVWIDTHPAGGHIVATMRDCADRLRACTCVTCGAPYPDHYDWCPQIRPVRDERVAVAS